MPVNPTTARYGFDASHVFRDRGLAAITTTTATTTILLDRLTSYFNANDQAQNLNTLLIVEVEAAPTGTITAFNATLQAGTGAGFTGAATVISFDLPTAAAGVYVLPVSRERIIQAAGATGDRIRVNFTLTGTTPSAQVNAFLSNVLGH